MTFYVINRRLETRNRYLVKSTPATHWTDNIERAKQFGSVGDAADYCVHKLGHIKDDMVIQCVELNIEDSLTVSSSTEVVG